MKKIVSTELCFFYVSFSNLPYSEVKQAGCLRMCEVFIRQAADILYLTPNGCDSG